MAAQRLCAAIRPQTLTPPTVNAIVLSRLLIHTDWVILPRLHNRRPDCTGLVDDGVIGCSYDRLSKSSARITYMLDGLSSGPPASFWCTYHDQNSSVFTLTPKKKISARAAAILRSKRLKSANLAKDAEPPSPDGDAAKLQMRVTAEVVFIIAICTLASCLLNLIFCVCCQMSRKYLHRLAKGAPRNHILESCLCLKSLSDTYKPKRFKRAGPFSRSNEGVVGSSALWNPLVLPGGYKFPPSEPIQRRKPLTNLTYFPSVHNDPSVALPPQNPAPDEVIYDDVHQSTIYLNNGDSLSQHNALFTSKNIPFDGILPSVSGSTNNGQNCIVDQNGMVYMAMGHVSQTPQPLRASLAASRVTLTTFQPEGSPKIGQRVPSQGSARSGIFNTPTTPSVSWMPRKETVRNVQINSAANQDLRGLPPQTQHSSTSKSETKTASIPSSLNPPIPFTDQMTNDEDLDDIFDMSKDTLLKSRNNESRKKQKPFS
ncbi:hypothetical protein Aperf_G00000008809 [Anoplocephala perfoliata]